MSKYSPFVDEAFDRSYMAVYGDDDLSGIRPEDAPRHVITGICTLVGLLVLFAAIGCVAVRYF